KRKTHRYPYVTETDHCDFHFLTRHRREPSRLPWMRRFRRKEQQPGIQISSELTDYILKTLAVVPPSVRGIIHVRHANDPNLNVLSERFLEKQTSAARVYIFGNNIDARHSHIVVEKPVPQCNGRPICSVAVHHTGRDHLEAFIWKTPFFQKVCAYAGGGAEVIGITSGSLDWPARGKNALILVTLEFFHCRPNCILVYPPFDYKDIGIDAMGYRKKGVNAFQDKSAHQQQSGSED